MSQTPNQPPPEGPQGSEHSERQAPVPQPPSGTQPPPGVQPGGGQPSGPQAPRQHPQQPPAPRAPSGGHPGHEQQYGQQPYHPRAPQQPYEQPSGTQQGHWRQGPPKFAPPAQPTFEQPSPLQGYPQAAQQPYGTRQPLYEQPRVVHPGQSAQGDGGDVLVAMAAHLAGFMIAFLGWIPPLAIYFVKRDKSQFIRHHSAEAANFQLTLLIPYVFAGVLIVGLGTFFGDLAWIGSLFLALTWIVSIALGVLGASGANKGAWYRYPISIRLLK